MGPVSNLSQAEDIVARQRLDAAIVDLNLRGQMASDFIRRLSVAKVPCLIVSGYGEDAIPQAVSGVPRLEKPVTPASVVDSLAEQLTRAG